MPHNNSSHFDTFGHDYWEIICLELWQNWVSTPDWTILFSEQFQKKIIIFTGGHWWTQIQILLIRKGLLRWVSWRQNSKVYSLMIHLRSLNQILNVFFEIELLPTTSVSLKIHVNFGFFPHFFTHFDRRLLIRLVSNQNSWNMWGKNSTILSDQKSFKLCKSFCR